MVENFKAITRTGILPIIKIEKLEHAVPLAGALRAGGINAMEIVVRNDIAYDAIHAISQAYPDMELGAGTIMTTDMADRAIAAGAKYLIAPGFDAEIVQHCLNADILPIPGISTPTEITSCVRMGLKLLKFFPAEPLGGIEMVKLLSAPFAGVKFIATGSIDEAKMPAYLRCDAVEAYGGNIMARPDVLWREDWAAVTAASKHFVDLSLGFELAHVGVNEESEEAALGSAGRMAEVFRMGVKNGNSSVFAGKAVEFMKKPYLGAKGHIAYYANSLERALCWFENEGIAVREDTIRRDAQGKLVAFYLQEEIGGFAVHVVRR